MGFKSAFKGLMKLELSRQISENTQISLKSVQWEPSCFIRAGGRTDGHNETNTSLFAILRTRPKKVATPPPKQATF